MTLRSGRKRIPRRADIWPRAYRRHPITAAIVLLLAVMVLWRRVDAPAGTDHDRYHNKTVTCVRVVDGDTLIIDVPDGNKDHTRVRLWGVDTPETDKSPRGAGYFGAEASEFARRMVEGKPVRIVLVPARPRDRYERLLAYVYLADSKTMLNEELLAQGYAYADHRFDHPWKQHFADLEKTARSKKLGLWENVTPDQYPEWRKRYEEKRSVPSPPADREEG
ncbi:MAG: hypothetical protein GXY44_10775 [Phycisphaerales bacterium]|nr:hypothetical protein [Phycisphaerales bacterium]